jgi:hypothetical protein
MHVSTTSYNSFWDRETPWQAHTRFYFRLSHSHWSHSFLKTSMHSVELLNLTCSFGMYYWALKGLDIVSEKVFLSPLNFPQAPNWSFCHQIDLLKCTSIIYSLCLKNPSMAPLSLWYSINKENEVCHLVPAAPAPSSSILQCTGHQAAQDRLGLFSLPGLSTRSLLRLEGYLLGSSKDGPAKKPF